MCHNKIDSFWEISIFFIEGVKVLKKEVLSTKKWTKSKNLS